MVGFCWLVDFANDEEARRPLLSWKTAKSQNMEVFILWSIFAALVSTMFTFLKGKRSGYLPGCGLRSV